jgi:dipeptidyl aminopeptidase/acylaminoacyl peptidase
VAPAGHPTTDRISTIFVVPSDGSSPPRALTDADHNNVAPRWSPDGRTLAFLSDRPVRGEAQLCVVPAGGGEVLRLTTLPGGVANAAWTPDGRSLAFTATRQALAGAGAPASEINVASEQWRPRAVATVGAQGGAPRLIGPAAGHVWTYAVAPDGRRTAAFVSPTEDLAGSWDNLNLVLFDAEGGDERVLGRFNGLGAQLVWSDDSRRIACLASRLPDDGDARVFIVDTDTGEMSALPSREMTPTAVRFHGDDLLVHAVDGQRTRIDRTDPLGAEWERYSLGPEGDAGWVATGADLDITRQGTAFLRADPRRPYDVYLAREGGPANRLSTLNPQLDGVALADLRPLEWRSPDGLRVEGWLALPPGREGERRLPLIVEVHGGPTWQWGNWFHGTWHDLAQTLAARGFAVFLPNPRGSTGRGGAFVDANRHDFGGRDYDDIIAGLDMLIDEGIADPDRLGICGWSFGGFMAAWAITRTQRFKAAVAGAAPTNWVSKIGTTDIGPFNEWNLGRVWDEPDRAWERSPIRYLRHVTTPTLIVHGEADKRVPVTQGVELYLGLRGGGIDTELVTYPRQEHSFHERAFQLDLLERTVGWFERFLTTAEC